MKLSAHYNKVSISISVVVLLAGALIYYFAIHKIARNQLDNELSEELGERIEYVNRYQNIPQKDFDENFTIYKKAGHINYPTRFFDTAYYDARNKSNEPGRAITGLIKVKNDYYLTTITESYDSINNLMQLITLITLGLMVFLLLILFVTNKYVLKGLWRPFYITLNDLNNFSISDDNTFSATENKVDEFNELNRSVEKMASRVKNDYRHLKHFTENASHEMMTPLAVITSKLDTLIQDETLKLEQLDQITDIYAAAAKLSRLNQSLLLLVKIENNLIDDAEPLQLDELIWQKTRQFHELITTKEIKLEHHLTGKTVTASKYLVEILLNNLFSNAVRHNVPDGLIFITLTTDCLVFKNLGAVKPLDRQTLFERFQKSAKSEGSGMGLAIVKNICNLYGWQINYDYRGQFHCFIINF
jgi:signal transduction histidine kinase